MEDGDCSTSHDKSEHHARNRQTGEQQQVGIAPEWDALGQLGRLSRIRTKGLGLKYFRRLRSWFVRRLAGHQESLSTRAAARRGIMISWCPVIAYPRPPDAACGRSTTFTRGR